MRSSMIFWPKIVLLSSLNLKRPKAFVSQSIMGDTVDGFEKSYTDERVGSYRPVIIFLIFFHSFITN